MALFPNKLFLRIAYKRREAYLLKILTLSITIACAILITLFSLNEFGFDRFHHNPNSVFRILQHNNGANYSGNRLSNNIPSSIFSSIQSHALDSVVSSRIKIMNEISIYADGKFFHDQKIHAVDSIISAIFSFEIIEGSWQNFDNHSVVLSETAAVQYFGLKNVAGQTIKIHTIGDTLTFSVAAVYKDFPRNSHENFNFFIKFNEKNNWQLGFDSVESGVYGRILKGNKNDFEKRINSKNQADLSYNLQPLPEIYFGLKATGEDARHGDNYSVLILTSLMVLILFLAITNFVNLTTLTLPYRSKELAIKKLAGTNQISLLLMFARESFSIVGASLIFAVLFIISATDFLEPVLGINLLSSIITSNATFFISILLLLLVLGFAPLLLTFRFIQATPTRLLSTDTITFPRFKRVITFLQLGISIFLIATSIVIRRQVNFSLVKEPGQNHDQVVYVSYPKNLTNEELRKLRLDWKKYNANILDVMATSQLPNRINSKELNSPFYFIAVDPGFYDFFNLKLTQGNWFKANNADSVVVLNERGKALWAGNKKNVLGVIKGVAGQFNMPEKPIKINLSPYYEYNFLCIRVLEVDVRRTVQYLSTYFDKSPATVTFLNSRFNEWVHYQDRLNTLSEILAIISGILSCCAIYVLSISLVRDKLKQIAVRKLCGASTAHIISLLVHEFTRQLLMAILVFAPITYIVINELLRNFVYSTPFQWTDSALPLAYCVFIILTLSIFQALSLKRADLSAALKE